MVDFSGIKISSSSATFSIFCTTYSYIFLRDSFFLFSLFDIAILSKKTSAKQQNSPTLLFVITSTENYLGLHGESYKSSRIIFNSIIIFSCIMCSFSLFLQDEHDRKGITNPAFIQESTNITNEGHGVVLDIQNDEVVDQVVFFQDL